MMDVSWWKLGLGSGVSKKSAYWTSQLSWQTAIRGKSGYEPVPPADVHLDITDPGLVYSESRRRCELPGCHEVQKV